MECETAHQTVYRKTDAWQAYFANSLFYLQTLVAVYFDTPQQLFLSKLRASRAIPDCAIDHTLIQAGVTPTRLGRPSKSLSCYLRYPRLRSISGTAYRRVYAVCRNHRSTSQLVPSLVILLQLVKYSIGRYECDRTPARPCEYYILCLFDSNKFV